ncbi:MAG: hypothetical protein E7456_03985 [Ruminococcaceae bacterium]|nr:hypothetical protein [Oscillospiraceae bacterium]
MDNWGFSKKKHENWPIYENGENVKPVLFKHIGGSPLDIDVEVSLLQAYNIPVILQYPNDGEFGKLILGHAGGGVDLYVPETMIEDAQNISNATICEEVEE